MPRGRRVDTDVWLEDQQGQRVISACRSSLKPDQAAKDKGGVGERPQPVVADVAELQLASTYSPTPERVKAYSMEGNSIHTSKPRSARALGPRSLVAVWGALFDGRVMAAQCTPCF